MTASRTNSASNCSIPHSGKDTGQFWQAAPMDKLVLGQKESAGSENLRPSDRRVSLDGSAQSQSGALRGAAAEKSRRQMPRTFAALDYYNYRLWFIGQLVSMFGTWMQTTAQGFLVYQITNSPAYLGVVGFAAGVPSWIFM